MHYTLKNLQCTKRHNAKKVSEYKNTTNAELQKCRKFVNILSTMNKIVSGNKRKTNAKLHYTLKILQCTKRHNAKKVSEYKHTANADYKSIEKFANVLQQYTKKLAETSVNECKIALHTENFANVFNGKFTKKQQVRPNKKVSENTENKRRITKVPNNL